MDRIGAIDGGGVLRIDIERLVDTRGMVQGSSGSGKSWLIRGIIERAASRMPVIVLDMEGEFVTLREKFDMVIAGEGGEVNVDVRSAALFGRRLLDLKLSAIVNLYDLTPLQRRVYMQHFLDGIMAAPRSAWGPRLIVIDEAHVFAPESSKAESLNSVIDLASRGRKRGYGLITATQRLSKLHKDVAAEMRNIFVGQTTLDLDARRAVDMLGFENQKDGRAKVRALDHQFYAFGPALSCQGVALFQADKPKTTHPEGGSRRKIAPPQPSRKIQSVLGELADLAAKADQEAATMADLQRKVRELERQLNSKAPIMPVTMVVDQVAIDRAIKAAVSQYQANDAKRTRKIERLNGSLIAIVNDLEKAKEQLADITAMAPATDSPRAASYIATTPVHKVARTSQPAPSPTVKKPAVKTGGNYPADYARPAVGDVKVGKSEFNVLRALYWLEADREINQSKIAFFAGYSPTASTTGVALSRLRQAGWIEGLKLTDEGRRNIPGNVEPKPTGAELREWIRDKVGPAENKILDVLVQSPDRPFTNDELADETGYSREASTVGVAVSKLRKFEAIEGSTRSGGVRAAAIFFE
jgi:hypothetical protein